MGIYYFAIERSRKERFEPPGNFECKSSGIFAKGNPFPAMVVMKNTQGYNFEVMSDVSDEEEDGKLKYKDITKEIYAELLDEHPEYEEEHEILV